MSRERGPRLLPRTGKMVVTMKMVVKIGGGNDYGAGNCDLCGDDACGGDGGGDDGGGDLAFHA